MKNSENKLSRSNRFLYSMWNLQKEMACHMRQTALNNDLSVPQYTILLSMFHHEGMMQKVIGERTKLPKSTLSQAIDGLVQKNILERKIDETNRRETQLVISKQGKSLIEEIKNQDSGIHQLMKQAVDSLSDEQFETAITVQNGILSFLKEEGSFHAENLKASDKL